MTDHEMRREHLISAAIAAGKFTEARAPLYRAQYDTDPVGTEKLISSLASIGAGILGHAAPAERQAGHVHPVVRAEESIELTPENVEGWTHLLFPETRAGAGAKQGRVTRSDAA